MSNRNFQILVAVHLPALTFGTCCRLAEARARLAFGEAAPVWENADCFVRARAYGRQRVAEARNCRPDRSR